MIEMIIPVYKTGVLPLKLTRKVKQDFESREHNPYPVSPSNLILGVDPYFQFEADPGSAPGSRAYETLDFTICPIRNI